MRSIKRIMAAIDFSDYSKETLEYAAHFARILNAEMIIVNVINQREIDAYYKMGQAYGSVTAVEFIETSEQERAKQIEELVEACSCQDLPIRTVLRTGVPFRELMGAVYEEKADLLVMGAKGRTNLRDLLLGSTAEKAFRRCPVPILSVRSESQKKALEERQAGRDTNEGT